MNITLKSIVQVSTEETYNAFTDLCYFKGYYWLTYRTGKGHISPNGKILVYRSKDGNNWEKKILIEKDGLDLRDPRWFIDNDRLILFTFTFRYYNTIKKRFMKEYTFFYEIFDNCSYDLIGTFDNSNPDEEKGIIWSMTRYRGEILATGYSFEFGHSYLNLWTTKDFQDWKFLKTIDESFLPAKLGFNESEIVVGNDNNLYIFGRVDFDNFSRLLPHETLKNAKKQQKIRMKTKPSQIKKFRSKFSDWFAIVKLKSTINFDDWEVIPYRMWLKGPRVIPYKDGFLGIFRYKQSENSPRKVQIFHIENEFKPLLTLAEGNDGSYAGFCWNPEKENELLVSIYSDHARLGTPDKGKINDIWIARLEIS